MKDKNIKYWLWGIIIIILITTGCIASFAQGLNPTVKSLKTDSICACVSDAKIWIIDHWLNY